MMVLGVTLALWVRWHWVPSGGNWNQCWQRTLGYFLFPPLLLVMTAISILCMGPSGQMMWHREGWLSYGLAIAFLLWTLILGCKLFWEEQQTIQQFRQYPVLEVQGNSARVLTTSELYSAQVGFWQSELVVSQGLLDRLDPAHLEAVLTHEQAHAHHRDTFWFFWLGWLRRIALWLPNTEALWQELLMLRELRADRRATELVDPLVLAESLLLVVSAPIMQLDLCAAFSWANSGDRLKERIDFILSDSEDPPLQGQRSSWLWLLVVLLPLLVVPFHGG
ncbi:M56 family metallopeptidase [Leptodesmis sp.]|uniref:M56 family metallopeptidase n=1 Tax=Leptodesmis sp. TaxID=3100501 RepID=UPI00405359FE